MTETTDMGNVLRRARDYYAQGPSHAPWGSAPSYGTQCALTAFWTAGEAASTGVVLLARAAGLDATLPQIPLRSAVMDWNAAASTEEVLAAFDRAIADADA